MILGIKLSALKAGKKLDGEPSGVGSFTRGMRNLLIVGLAGGSEMLYAGRSNQG